MNWPLPLTTPQPRWPGIPVLVALLVLTASHVAALPLALLVIDSGRDIANAWVIAQGLDLPMRGPSIYRLWYLGPVWFYALAIPLLLGGSVTALSLWVGALAAAKVPLAYLLGRRWHGSTGGLLLAGIVSIPGWASVGEMVIVHTSVIEAAVLASLLASTISLSQSSLRSIASAWFVLALAMHAHPTAVFAAPLALMASYHAARCIGTWRVAAVGILAFSVPWLPMLVAESMSQWPQLATTSEFLAGGGFLTRSSSVPSVLYSTITGWPSLVAEFLIRAPWMHWPLSALGGALAVLAVIGTAGAVLRRSVIALLLSLQAAAALWGAVVLRPDVPVYMLFAVFPLAAWTACHGIVHLLGNGRALAAVAWLAVTLGACLQLWVLEVRHYDVSTGTSRPFPGQAMSDVRAPLRDDGWVRFWLAAKDHQTVARSLCSPSASIHGELASAFAWSRSLALESECRPDERPSLGGADRKLRTVGIPLAHAGQLGIPSTHPLAGFALLQAEQVVVPSSGLAATADPEYAVWEYRKHAETGTKTLPVRVECRAGLVVVVNNLMPGLNHSTIRGATPSGSVSPLLATGASTYFPCDGDYALLLELESLNLAALEVFSVRQASD